MKVFKAVRYEFYCYGDVLVTTAQPARSKKCYKSKSRSGIVFTPVYETRLDSGHIPCTQSSVVL